MSVASVLRIVKLTLCAAAAIVAAQDAGDPGDAIDWADEGDSSTVMCVQMFKFLLDSGGVKIQDGEIATGSLFVNPKYAAYADAMLANAALTGQGVTTNIDSKTGKVTLRTDGGAARSDNGELLNLNLFLKVSIDAFAKDLPPVCKDILIKRLVVSSGAGGGVGDPHLTTLDHVNYDFQKPTVSFTQLHGFSLTDNLFTCTEGDCEKYTSQPTQKDYNATKLPSDMRLLHQGFTPLIASDIPVHPFTPALTSTTTTHSLRRRRVEDDLEYAKQIAKRARELCYQVFNQTTACAPYVTNTTNYIEAVCIGDSIMVSDLSIVDNTKISYLRDCRRELDARIESNVTTPAETAQLMADRKALTFGDTGKCPKDCSGRGSCLAAACKCDLGFTGLSCDIVVY